MAAKRARTVSKAPQIKVRASTTLGELADFLGLGADQLVLFIQRHMKSCAWAHTTIAVFETHYFCAADRFGFLASTCDRHADHAPCPICGEKARRTGIRSTAV